MRIPPAVKRVAGRVVKMGTAAATAASLRCGAPKAPASTALNRLVGNVEAVAAEARGIEGIDTAEVVYGPTGNVTIWLSGPKGSAKKQPDRAALERTRAQIGKLVKQRITDNAERDSVLGITIKTPERHPTDSTRLAHPVVVRTPFAGRLPQKTTPRTGQ